MTFLSGHLTNSELRTAADALATANSSILTVQEYGDSGALDAGGKALPTPPGTTLAGERMWCLRLCDSPTGARPALVLWASIHPREVSTTWAAWQWVQDTISAYNANDPEAQLLLSRNRIYVFPICNPDRRRFMELYEPTGTDSGRKTVVDEVNRALDTAGATYPSTTTEGIGYDIGRGFPTYWDNPPNAIARATAANVPSGDAFNYYTYGGTAHSQIVEVTNLRTKLQSIIAEADTHPASFVSLEAPLDVIGYAPAGTATPLASDLSLSALWAIVGAAGTGYSSIGRSYDVIYPINGSPIDEAITLGAVNAGLVEMDAGLLSAPSTAEDEYNTRTKAVLDQLARLSYAPLAYGTAPTTQRVHAFAHADGRLVVYGTSDHPTAVSAVHVSVGDPPDTASTPYLADADTGSSFGSTSVRWSARLPSSSFTSGTATVYVQALSGSTRGEVRSVSVTDATPQPDLSNNLELNYAGPTDFDGSTAIDLGTTASGVLPPFTLCGSITADTLTGTIVSRRNGGTVQWQLYLATSGDLGMRSNSGWPSGTAQGTSTTRVTTGAKYWIAGVVDSSGNSTFYRRRNEREVSEAAETGGTFQTIAVDTLVGARRPGTSYAFDGTLENVRVYSRDNLSAEERRLLEYGEDVPTINTGLSSLVDPDPPSEQTPGTISGTGAGGYTRTTAGTATGGLAVAVDTQADGTTPISGEGGTTRTLTVTLS